MKTLLVLAIVSLVSCMALEGEELHAKWHQYKLKHGKVYEKDEEDEMRKNLWHDNFKMVEEHNKKYEAGEVTYDMEQNHFSDISEEERKQYLNAMPPQDSFESSAHLEQVPANNKTVPDSWDWRKIGGVNPVKYQGRCGSCWIFSAMAAVEFQYWNITNGTLLSFSEQQVNDCNGKRTCGTGGWMPEVFQYLRKNRIQTSVTYPYIGKDKPCVNYTQSGINISIVHVEHKSQEEVLKNAVHTMGVLANAMNAVGSIYSYKSGVYYEPANVCPNNTVNHGVAIVGYGTDPKGGDYWIIRNSWGQGYGEKGYMRVARNRGNVCSIATHGMCPILRK
ncbi:Cathepsin L2 [Cichlidogyrus casuarinus]|uniref:Cathepsin L2 n=1 Tax=Cichlidogyrus casuarinus TaxID=1844966 RepID=A0ABD2PJ28_9PLAT